MTTSDSDDLESDFDYICRSLLEQTDRVTMIQELGRRNLTPNAAERFISHVEKDLKLIGGCPEEYEKLQRRYSILVLISLLMAAVCPIVAFTLLEDLGLVLIGPFLGAIGASALAISRKRKYAKYRRLLSDDS